MANYIALLHKEPKSDYGVSFPDFPGCVTAGRTLDEARAMAEEALAFHIEGMLAEGEAIPEPASLDAIVADPENRNAVPFLVSVPDAKGRAVRVNITLPENVLKEIDVQAGRAGLSRSAFLAQAAKRVMGGGAEADERRRSDKTLRGSGKVSAKGRAFTRRAR